MLELHWLENINFFPGLSQRGESIIPLPKPHIFAVYPRNRFQQEWWHMKSPRQAPSPDPREVCADSRESLTANKMNYPDLLAAFCSTPD